MIRIKNLSVPLISALCASAIAPAVAQVELIIRADKTYRQDKKGVQFREGSYDVNMSDGDGVFQGGCERPQYWGANIAGDPCPLGATAFLIPGSSPETISAPGPYFSAESVIPAIIIEPRRPELAFLRAAPASKLPRPEAGFTDTSFGLYYNLQSTAIREYIVSRYYISRDYNSNQRALMESQIVPGEYYYSFPRLGNVNLVSAVNAKIYPMTEGYAKINNRNSGFRYTSVNGTKWTSKGFVKLSGSKPNILKWEGFSPANVYPGVDKLFLSIRALSNPNDPKSATDLINNATDNPQSVFPNFATGGDPRVSLTSPFVTSYTLPPIFPSGTSGVLELELERTLQGSGISYDLSTRKFQIPILVVDEYTDYASITFNTKKPKRGLLDDYDGDGFNNLTEWILGSNAAALTSNPTPPVAELHPEVTDPLTLQVIDPRYYGFTFDVKLGTDPAVDYTIQRSKDGGVTWSQVVADDFWVINKIRTPAVETAVETLKIRLESRAPGVQPPGSANDIYRIKITTQKK